jgi:hypothetical protein
VIDSGLDILARQDPPNDGVLNTIGKLGIDVSEVAGFDIAPDGNRGFAALRMASGTGSDLYSIDLTTGDATRVGPIGSGHGADGCAGRPAVARREAGRSGRPGDACREARYPRHADARDPASDRRG